MFLRLVIPSDFVNDLFSASVWHWTALVTTSLLDLFLLLTSLKSPCFLGYLTTALESCSPAVIFFGCLLPAIHTTISLTVGSYQVFKPSCTWFPALQLCFLTAPKLQPHLLNRLLDTIVCMPHGFFQLKTSKKFSELISPSSTEQLIILNIKFLPNRTLFIYWLS